MATKQSQNVIVLKSEGFSLHGQKVNDLDWYEFDAYVDGQEFKNIGGENRRIVLKKLIEILSKNKGTRLSDIKNVPYKEQVGGDETEYIGYLVVSGYNTFYFFKSDGYLKHVVFADNEGKLLAHSELQPGFSSSWLEALSSLQIPTND